MFDGREGRWKLFELEEVSRRYPAGNGLSNENVLMQQLK
jgi:hypothetical protein